MSRLKIGLVLESVGKPFRAALETAARLGVGGVQLDAVGEFAPDNLTGTGRREVRHRMHAQQLQLTAVGCPLRHGFDVEQGLEGRIAHVKKVMGLAFDLGPRLVVIAAGTVPPDEQHPTRALLRDTLTDLSRHGDRTGVRLALVAGSEPPATLAAFLATFDTAGLGVNLDPALLIMQSHDTVQAVRDLKGWVLHTHARDARRGRLDRAAQEVALGAGDTDWTAYLGALEEIDYRGWLTIKRGPAPDAEAGLKAAVGFLRRLVG
jgi:sugar phosphate isomerase/epimerase